MGTVPINKRALTSVAVGGGAVLLVNAASGGRIGDALVASTWGRRHEFGFALRHALQPGVVLDTYRSAKDAEAMQRATWGRGNHADDGVDAMRHSYAAALLAARLVHDRGMSAADAQAIVVEAGHAHELDGADRHELAAGGATAASSAMDEHNNAAGARIGALLAGRIHVVPSTPVLLDALRAAAADGQLVVLEHGAPRATRAGDIPPVSGS